MSLMQSSGGCSDHLKLKRFQP